MRIILGIILSFQLLAQTEQFNADNDKTQLSGVIQKSNELSKKIQKELNTNIIEESYMNLASKEIFEEDNFKYEDKLSCLMELTATSFCPKSVIQIPGLKAVAIFGIYQKDVGYYLLNRNFTYFINLTDIKNELVEGRLEVDGQEIYILKDNFRYAFTHDLDGEKKIKEQFNFYGKNFKNSKINRVNNIEIAGLKQIHLYLDSAIDCSMTNILTHLNEFRDKMRNENLSSFDTIGYKHYQSYLRCSEIFGKTKNKSFQDKLKSLGSEFKEYIIHPSSL